MSCDGVNDADDPSPVITSSSSDHDMTTTSRHYFGDSIANSDSFCITIIELGAGTSLPGLVAAKVGSDVTLTDDANKPEVLANMRRVSDLNNLSCNVMGLTWGLWDADIFSIHPKIILGADVLYDTSGFDDLFATVAFLLQSSPGSVLITTYHNRSGHHLIEFLMAKWGLKCVKLLDGFSFLPSTKASGLSGNIQLAEIVLNS